MKKIRFTPFSPSQRDSAEERIKSLEGHIVTLQRELELCGQLTINLFDGTTLYGSAASECTVDGTHATDLGFYQIAGHMAPVIEKILTQ